MKKGKEPEAKNGAKDVKKKKDPQWFKPSVDPFTVVWNNHCIPFRTEVFD